MSTISRTFQGTVSLYGDQMAIRYAANSYTWNDYNASARSFAKGLIAQGVAEKSAVTIQGSNSPLWLFANLGTIMAGAVSAGVYPTNGEELSKHAAVSSQAEVVVVEDEKQLKKYEGMQNTAVKCFVVWNKCQQETLLQKPVYSWDEFIKQGEAVADDVVDQRIDKQKPDDVCSLIYTSGTTGMPKAAALTHDALGWAVLATGRKFSLHKEHHGISYLPLSHIAAQQLDCIGPLTFGYSVDIAPPDALKGNNLKTYLVNARPTYFLAVPRVWEKFKEGIEQKVKEANPLQQGLFSVATTLGRWAVSVAQHSDNWLLLRISDLCLWIFHGLVFNPIKRAIGLDRCEIAACGSGMLDPEVYSFFAGLNIRIIDIYGMSETSGPATVDGKAIDGVQIKIAQPDDEICLKGRNIFKKYWANDAATKEVFDDEGYLKTGDKGTLDADGNLIITGRIKELLKTAGGENIPPVRIEQKIQQELPMVSQAVVIGDRRRYLTCLLTLKEDANLQAINEYVQKGLDRVNMQADSQAHVVQKFSLLDEEFSVANGLMTPTLKLRRAEIAKRYATAIEQLYT